MVLFAIWFTSAHVVPFPTNANQDHSKSQTFRKPLGTSSLKGLCCICLKHNQLRRLHSPTLPQSNRHFSHFLGKVEYIQIKKCLENVKCAMPGRCSPSSCLFVGDAPHHHPVWTRQIRYGYLTSPCWLEDSNAIYCFISKKVYLMEFMHYDSIHLWLLRPLDLL